MTPSPPTSTRTRPRPSKPARPRGRVRRRRPPATSCSPRSPAAAWAWCTAPATPPVAGKALRGRSGGPAAPARRFVEEAQITGQLQHPNIPPVYQTGALTDGSPFLAMKLIKGDTLADLLARPDPDHGRLVA